MSIVVDHSYYVLTYCDGELHHEVEVGGLKWVDDDLHGGVIAVIDGSETFIPWSSLVEGPTYMPETELHESPIDLALQWVRATFPILASVSLPGETPFAGSATTTGRTRWFDKRTSRTMLIIMIETYQGCQDPQCTKKHALVSVRISRLTESSTATKRQKNHAVPFAEGLGFCIRDVAEDLDISGAVSVFDRPKLGPWLEKPNEYAAIVFQKLDRITRNLFDFVKLLEWAKKHGVALLCMEPLLDFTSKEGMIVGLILAHFADLERQTMIARVNDHRESNLAEGKFIGGNRPFWTDKVARKDLGEYGPEAEGYVLVNNPERLKTVRRLCELVTLKHSYPEVAKRLTEEGHPAPHVAKGSKQGKSGQWRADTVRRIACSKTLLGYREVRIQDGDDYMMDVERRDGIPIRYFDPALTDDEWTALQLETSSRGDGLSKARNRTELRGVTRCANCGRGYSPSKKTHKGKTYIYFNCASAGTVEPCGAKSTNGIDVWERVHSDLIAPYADRYIFRQMISGAVNHGPEIAQLKTDLERLTSQWRSASSKIVKEHLEYQIQEIDGRLHELEQIPAQEATVTYESTGETVLSRWEALDGFGRGDFLRELGIKILCDGPAVRLDVPEEVGELLRTWGTSSELPEVINRHAAIIRASETGA